MRVESELKLDFDDVLIRPKRSVAPSRASVDLKRKYRFRTPCRRREMDRHPHHRRQSRHHRHDADGGGPARS